MGTLRQTLDATMMAYVQTLRELGVLIPFVVLFPIGFLFFLGVLVPPSAIPQVVAGSVMMELALLNVNALAQTIGQDKQSKIYDLWVSLPINPIVYVASQALAFLPPSLLATGVTLGVAVVVFHVVIPATLIPALLVAFLLVWASTLGVGFLLGVYGGPPRRINQLAQFVGIIMTFFAPIFYPLSILPTPLQYLAEAWPVTWGAVLMNDLLRTGPASALVPGLVLLAFAVGSLVVIAAGLRWRQV